MMVSLCIFLPLGAAGLMLLVPGEARAVHRFLALAGSSACLIVLTILALDFHDHVLGDDARQLFESRVSDVLAEISPLPSHPGRLELTRILGEHPLPDDPAIVKLALSTTAKGTTYLKLYQESLEMSLAARSRMAPGLRFVEHHAWIPTFNIHYFVGIDGLSLPLVWLTALLSFLGVLWSWQKQQGVKAYFQLWLVLTAGLVGAFAACDLFLMLVCWQLVLAAVCLLIAGWGGPGRQAAAARSFFYTQIGSLLLLLLLLTYHFTPPDIRSFNLLTLGALSQDPSSLPLELQSFGLAVLLASLAFVLPVFPLHSWLGPALIEAPAAVGAVVIAGLVKLGGYALLRLGGGLCPQALATAGWTLTLSCLGLFALFYGGLCAIRQVRAGMLVAHASVASAGLVLIGVASLTEHSWTGAAYHLCTAGTAAALIILASSAAAARTAGGDGARDLLTGLAWRYPLVTAALVFGLFAMIAMPPAGTFVSQTLVLMGTWSSEGQAAAAQREGYVPRGIGVLVLLGIALALAYVMPWVQALLRHAVEKQAEPADSRDASPTPVGEGDTTGRVATRRYRPLSDSNQRPDTRRVSGTPTNRLNPLAELPVPIQRDLDLRETFCLCTLALVLIFLGVRPQATLESLLPAVKALLEMLPQ